METDEWREGKGVRKSVLHTLAMIGMVVVDVSEKQQQIEVPSIDPAELTNTMDETAPAIVPCYYGKEVGINAELVSTGLSAISIKHKVAGDYNRTPSKMTAGDNFPHRNSFWNLHRPELTKLTQAPSFSTRNIEVFFHEHASKHGEFCEALHKVSDQPTHEEETSTLKVIHPPSTLNIHYDEDEEGDVPVVTNRSIQLTDEDLDPANVLHKSRAEFCVTIGHIQPSPLTRSTSSKLPVTTPSPVQEVRKYSLPNEVGSNSRKIKPEEEKRNQPEERITVHIKPKTDDTVGKESRASLSQENQTTSELKILLEPREDRRTSEASDKQTMDIQS